MDYLVYPAIIGLAGIVFLAIILILATPPKYTKKIMGWIVTLSVIAALGMYGYGYGYGYKKNAE